MHVVGYVCVFVPGGQWALNQVIECMYRLSPIYLALPLRKIQHKSNFA